ncbi:MAG TPA: pyridoxamine 5'-phosphate oxidase family protein [Acidimicrobiia bacterium]|nr:pyridoxamine 5'-phosphate oxidase family protein [Acidimicrobiia bacterium]
MFSKKAIGRLQDEPVIWMTTVSDSGQPQTSLVWFLWTGSDFLIYSLDPSPRIRNITGNPQVALNFDGDGRGGDLVIVEGTATIGTGTAAERDEFTLKYRHHMQREFGGPDDYFSGYPTAVRVEPKRVREYVG